MTKIGRNTLCPCGSGKKYKHCCGKLSARAPQGSGPNPESIAQMRLELARHEAREHQRRLMQGLGRPIISFEDHGYRIVAIGNQLRWSKAWRTFPDFLFDYIKYVLTPEWGNAELEKPESERHPLLGWYRKVCEFQQAWVKDESNGIYSGEMTGAVRAYLGLAYDLYLCAHNAELPDLLVKRLRNSQTFEGALYEAYVIGNLAKAGFDIELEDEGDSTRSHCELTATHQDTKRKFSVEAKAVASTSSRAGASAAPPRIRSKLYEALRKRADHERLIFIELNRAELGAPGHAPDWARHVDSDLAQAERELTIEGEPAPSAYVFVTNRGFMHAFDSERWTEVGLACGYKIDDFASRTGAKSILQLARARERHAELHWLRKALQKHNAIPNSFGDHLPEEKAGDDSMPRLLIGSTHMIPDQDGKDVLGVLTNAVVMEPERKAYGTYRLQDGRHVICTAPLTDAEIAAYKRSPDTFLGVIKQVSKDITEPLDAYDLFWQVYFKSSQEALLEWVSTWPDYAVLSKLDQKELAQIYCARMAEMMWATHVRNGPGQA
jgi:SEC-C motif